ncbi:DoxX family protein [Pseudonocardia sp. DLS-67]
MPERFPHPGGRLDREDPTVGTVTTVVTVLAAAWTGFSAYALLARKAFVVDNLVEYGVPEGWWPWLAAAKTLGAAGLLAGLAVPGIGVAAAVGLFLYFTGAVITVVRARSYGHIPFPLLYLVPALAAGWLLAGS